MLKTELMYLIHFLRRNLPEWDWDFPSLGGSSRITAVICGSPRPVQMAVLLKSLYQQHSNERRSLGEQSLLLEQALNQTSLPHWQTSEETNVRFGSLADILRCNRHVRFTPESGHRSVAGKKRVVALATRSKKQSRAEGDLQLPE
jgi:hypothetical protein